jgi:2-polyprenyl-3-methyl-5-hydroxy-6-metoxy-1,4-benzoquinol methylase
LKNPIKDKWDKHYHSCANDVPSAYPEAAEVLFQNQHLLPKQGTALDLACGKGANAICLAKNGLNTSAWDISSAALEQLSLYAEEKQLSINLEARDVSQQPPKSNSFDVIVVSRFLDRNLMDHIKNSVNPGGLIFYQTFTKEKVTTSGPNNTDYLLDKNELITIFIDWNIVLYKEEGIIGSIELGFRNQAMLIAQKPAKTS